MSIDENKEFLRTARPFSGAKAIMCIWCGEAALYADKKTPPEYLVTQMKEHDLNCFANPLQAKIEQLQADLESEVAVHRNTMANYEQLQAELDKHRWIPVSERLPEAKIKVLTLCGCWSCDKEPAVAWAREQGEWLTYGNSSGSYTPSHWKPIILP